jgi:hypothetical protein
MASIKLNHNHQNRIYREIEAVYRGYLSFTIMTSQTEKIEASIEAIVHQPHLQGIMVDHLH